MPRASARTSNRIVIYELRITIVGIKPAVWRQVLVPSVASLEYLHVVIQECFGWQDYHLYRFDVLGRAFESPESDSGVGDARSAALSSLNLKVGSKFRYTYDFGDDWQHEVQLVGTHAVGDEMFYPACIGGARAGPLEDSSGSYGYMELINILADPTHPEYAERLEWSR